MKKLAGRETDDASPRERYEARQETVEASPNGRKPTGLRIKELNAMKTSSLHDAYRAGAEAALAKHAFQAPPAVSNVVNPTKLQSYPDINQRQNISAPPAGGNVPGSQPASASTQTGASDIPKLAAPVRLSALMHNMQHAGKDLVRHEVKKPIEEELGMGKEKRSALSLKVEDITRRKPTPKKTGAGAGKGAEKTSAAPSPMQQSSNSAASPAVPFSSVPPPNVSQASQLSAQQRNLAPALAPPPPSSAPITNPAQEQQMKTAADKAKPEAKPEAKAIGEGSYLLPADPEAADKIRKEALRRREEKAAGPKTNLAKNTSVGCV